MWNDTSFDTNSFQHRLSYGLKRLCVDQAFLKSERRSLLQAWDHVRVDVQSGTYLGMSQSFLHDFCVNPLLQHEQGVGVSGIMEPVAVQTGPSHYLHKGCTITPRQD